VSFLEIFQPGLKQLYEEKERQRMLVIRPSHGADPPLGIDLDAGTASIRIPGRSARVDQPTDDAAGP
jgi:Family of unknown function (DUF6191)